MAETQQIKFTALVPLQPNAALQVKPAYSQAEEVIIDGTYVRVSPEQYATTPPDEKLNKFDAYGAPYLPTVKNIYLHPALAKVVQRAAEILAEQNHSMIALDGLRTYEANAALAVSFPNCIEMGLLARPGKSAHNKALAVDVALLGPDKKLVNMNGHFDCADMQRAHRNYTQLSPEEKQNRLRLEKSFLRAALEQGVLVAPLREEFWDFRMPETRLDLWRVLESVARVIDDQGSLAKTGAVIDDIRRMYRAGQHMEAIKQHSFFTYESFQQQWSELFAGKEQQLTAAIGTSVPPADESKIVYHGNYVALHDDDLPPEMRQANLEIAAKYQAPA